MPTLLRELKKFYKTGKRSLPWRHTRDPYKVLVSEVMLQQTQVERVVPYYKRFIQEFPTARALARAPLSRVLRLWSGLGYNRRAKYLHDAAKLLSTADTPRKNSLARENSPKRELRDGRPEDFFAGSAAEMSTEFLESLPGVGHYTARAVAAFAYNRPEVFVETNIRTVFLHHLSKYGGLSSVWRRVLRKKVGDAELLPLVEEALKKSRMEPRDFYWALMDYGAHLKRAGVRLNQQSTHYTKQSKFEGSRRQKRAAHLRALLARGASEKELERALHS